MLPLILASALSIQNIQSNYTFIWTVRRFKLTYSVTETTWADAFERAEDYCIKTISETDGLKDLDHEAVVLLCVNPKGG